MWFVLLGLPDGLFNGPGERCHHTTPRDDGITRGTDLHQEVMAAQCIWLSIRRPGAVTDGKVGLLKLHGPTEGKTNGCEFGEPCRYLAVVYDSVGRNLRIPGNTATPYWCSQFPALLKSLFTRSHKSTWHT